MAWYLVKQRRKFIFHLTQTEVRKCDV